MISEHMTTHGENGTLPSFSVLSGFIYLQAKCEALLCGLTLSFSSQYGDPESATTVSRVFIEALPRLFAC